MIGLLPATALAVYVAAHVALLARLRGRVPWTRVALSFFLPPLAPYYGFRHGLVWGAWAWLGALALYACLALTLRGL